MSGPLLVMDLTLDAQLPGVPMGRQMFVLPPPDPNEGRELPPLELSAPVALFLADLPTVESERFASALLDWRPGALVVAGH